MSGIDTPIKIQNLYLKNFILGYLTITQSGFSENELQDILSLDNELMKLFKANDLIKSESNILQLPWFYIIRLLNSLRNHLLIRPFNGIYTISWKHQIFNKIIQKRYIGKFFNYLNLSNPSIQNQFGLDENPTFLMYLHKNICEYYLGIWSSPKEKPLTYEKIITPVIPDDANRALFSKPVVKKFRIHSDRLVPAQPIKYEDFHTHIKPRYNLRKLNVLPYHLIHANMIKGINLNVPY